MAERGGLRVWVVEALRQLGGEGTIVQVCHRIWQVHESDLRESGDLFYTWQYDVRWAAQFLRDTDLLLPVGGSRTKRWALSDAGRSVALAQIPTHGR